MRQRIGGLGFLLLWNGTVVMAQSAQAGPPAEWAQPQQQQRFFKDQANTSIKMNLIPQGRWWTNPHTVEMLGMTNDQVKKVDEIFQQHRLKLIDLNASLAKEEAILEPLVGADQPDDNKVLPQIDRVAQARAELEKSNARMLWAIRRVLTPEQWKKLESERKPSYFK